MTKALLCTITIVLATGFAFGQIQEKALWSFGGYYNGRDGEGPTSKLIFDSAGNLYGTTECGGSYLAGAGLAPCGIGYGTVFELSPNPGGMWSERILYSFSGPAYPQAGLVMDSAGNLFGTTENGGGAPCSNQMGCGAVFELSLNAGGTWTEVLEYGFCDDGTTCTEGSVPLSDLTLDAQGNLYGTTSVGGLYGGGTVFELSRQSGDWTESTLYNFCSKGQLPNCVDGWKPVAGVTFDNSGNLYGTTAFGGSNNSDGGGVVFKLSPQGSGWTETVLYAFSPYCTTGCTPSGDVVFDAAGNLYSTVESGNNLNGGVFRLTPKNGGHEYTFFLDGTDGAVPAAGVLIDPGTRTLYGTASKSGAGVGGTVFSITGTQATVLYSFCSKAECLDGDAPLAALIQDNKGNLYGTAVGGGYWSAGVVFKISP